MTAPAHRVEPDGYCPTCQTLGCRQPRPDDRTSAQLAAIRGQLDRLESKLNRFMRRAGMDPTDPKENG